MRTGMNRYRRDAAASLSPWRVIALSLAAGLLFASFAGLAQGGEDYDASDFVAPPQPGAPGTPEELRAFSYVQQNKLIKAREAAEALVRANPDSHVGEFVLAWVHHYAEANFPMAMFHMNKAMQLFEAQNGTSPQQAGQWPWQWHARYLRELGGIHGDLEEYAERVAYIERYNEWYNPKIIAGQAWPLMKMHRYEEARAAAEDGIASGEPREIEIALNSLCAIEFEAGNDGESYEACRAAVEYARRTGQPSAVDLANFAEASRSVFNLAEAERVLLEASEASAAWYGNPWLELGELYTRGARFPEALQALREVPGYRAQRPPHVRDSDRNESRRALSAFFLTVGRAQEALDVTEAALVMPDRRAHNSRDPAQDRAIIALLDRRARRTVAERRREFAAGEDFLDRLWAGAQAWRLEFEGWLSGRQAVKLLSEEERLVGVHRIGTSRAAVVPPWLVGELAEVAGAGVERAAITRARSLDGRDGAPVYYDAFEAEAALVAGDEERAIELAERARRGLGAGESLLRARVDAIRAEAMQRRGDTSAPMAYEQAIEDDPGVFRRLGFTIPVTIESSGGEIADAIVDGLERSPRFDTGERGLDVTVRADAANARICLMGAGGTVYDCVETTPESTDSPDAFAARALQAFHERAFQPRIDLSQGDIHGLDGSSATSRDPLQGISGP